MQSENQKSDQNKGSSDKRKQLCPDFKLYRPFMQILRLNGCCVRRGCCIADWLTSLRRLAILCLLRFTHSFQVYFIGTFHLLLYLLRRCLSFFQILQHLLQILIIIGIP